MSKSVYYRQCTLSKKTEKGYKKQVSWMPEPYTTKGKVLKLKNSDGEWEDGWVVESEGRNRLSQDLLPDFHVMVKSHRKNTGDAEPKMKK